MLGFPLRFLLFTNLILLSLNLEFEFDDVLVNYIPEADYVWFGLFTIIFFEPFRFGKLFIFVCLGYTLVDLSAFCLALIGTKNTSWIIYPVLEYPFYKVYESHELFLIWVQVSPILGHLLAMVGFMFYRDSFKWLLYWQLYKKLLASGNFNISISQYIFWGSYRGKTLFAGHKYKIGFSIRGVKMVFTLLTPIMDHVVIKFTNKLNLLKKYFFKN